jgi:hypothetical protein
MTDQPNDKTQLNAIEIPLAEVRKFIVDLMRDGRTTYPLGDFLVELRAIYRDYYANKH